MQTRKRALVSCGLGEGKVNACFSTEYVSKSPEYSEASGRDERVLKIGGDGQRGKMLNAKRGYRQSNNNRFKMSLDQKLANFFSTLFFVFAFSFLTSCE